MKRSAFSLVEILVAAALVGGPLVLALGLGIEGTRSTGRQLDRATAQLLATDMAEWIAAQDRVRPGVLARTCAESVRSRWLRAGTLTTEQRIARARRLDEMLATLKIGLERVPGTPRMIAVRISLEPSPGQVARAAVLVHDGRR